MKTIALMAVALLCCVVSRAQIEVRGTVVSQAGTPVAYASVQVDSQYTMTDREGRFEMAVPAGHTADMTISHISYHDVSLPFATYRQGHVEARMQEKVVELPAMAQEGIVWDRVNHIPVPHASLLTNWQGQVLATSTDSAGRFRVAFPFHSLSVSHLNYAKLKVTALADTLFLTPKAQVLTEVVVSNEEPKWIREKLGAFLENRKSRYQTADRQMEYDYAKSNVGDSSSYAFQSVGLMYVPSLHHLDCDSMYQVCPDRNVVQYKDSTAGVDFYDLQLMLYENVMAEMDHKFIRHHVFRQNEAYQNGDKNILQLAFWSEKYKDDRGFLTIDTARCVILDASRSTGMACNLDEKMNALVLSLFHAAVGLQYDEWTIDNTIHYEARGGVYYPSRITYQYYEKRSSYDKFATSKTKKRMEYFASKEATLTLHDTTRTPGPRYYDIPHEIHSAIIYIESRRHSRNSIAVSKMPREYQKLKE